MRQLLVVVFLFLSPTLSAATDFVFENDLVRLAVDARGRAVSLREKDTSTEWLESEAAPLFAVRKSDKWHPSTSIRKTGRIYQVDFGQTGVTAIYTITGHKNYIVFELVDLQGNELQAIRLLHLRTKGLTTAGHLLAVRWNEQFAVVPLGLSPRVHASLSGANAISATVYPEFGMIGEKVALVSVQTKRLMGTIQMVEKDFGLPFPTINGQWAKQSDDIRTSYLFIDLTAWNVDEVIRYAKLGGFTYILIYANTWSSSRGSYPVNLKNFPLGERSLKFVVDKVHDAGLKVGIHTLTSLVSKNDRLVRPVPDPRLLKGAEAILTDDVDAEVRDLPVSPRLQSSPIEAFSYDSPNARLDVQIGHEIIQCRDKGNKGVSDSIHLTKCARGYAGTKATSHRRGTKVFRLVERYGSYLGNLTTSLKEEISERIAGLVNRVKLDMVYFDGGEANRVNGPAWYWVSQQQDDTLRRVRRDVLVEGPGRTHWTWHWFSRAACGDFAVLATHPYLDHYKIAERWRAFTNMFMPAQLGWWAILGTTSDHPATKPEEAVDHLVRMLALDAPISLETRVARLRANGRVEEMLDTFRTLERLRLRGGLSKAERLRLRTQRWHWDASARMLQPVRYETRRVGLSGEEFVTNGWHAQPLKLRLEAMPLLTEPGDKSNIPLLRVEVGGDIALTASNDRVPIPGALIRRIKLAPDLRKHPILTGKPRHDDAESGRTSPPLDLSLHRALAVRLFVGDAPSNRAGPTPVLNIQLESKRKTYRDYYVELNFSGEKTVIIPESNVEKLLPDLRPSHKSYPLKRAMQEFDFSAVHALNLRWMQPPTDRKARVNVSSIEALAESEGYVRDPEVRLASGRLIIPSTLATGDYAEWWGKGSIKVFDSNGVLISKLPPSPNVPILESGLNRFVYNAEGHAPVKLTVITFGYDAISLNGNSLATQ